MLTFASAAEPAYLLATGWQASLALLTGQDVSKAERLAARRFLLGLPHGPPLDAKGKPLMGVVEACKLGRMVHGRVAACFFASETARPPSRGRLAHPGA